MIVHVVTKTNVSATKEICMAYSHTYLFPFLKEYIYIVYITNVHDGTVYHRINLGKYMTIRYNYISQYHCHSYNNTLSGMLVHRTKTPGYREPTICTNVLIITPFTLKNSMLGIIHTHFILFVSIIHYKSYSSGF